VSELFERAVRQKLRFNFRGQMTTEDLWDLSVEHLDAIYQGLRSEQKETCEESLIKQPTRATSRLSLQIDIVKHIVEVKLEEAELRKSRAENKLRKDRITAVLAERQDEKFKSMSEEDLQKELESLDV
jgi:hypothetical protein